MGRLPASLRATLGALIALSVAAVWATAIAIAVSNTRMTGPGFAPEIEAASRQR
jgi:hypothetical protein